MSISLIITIVHCYIRRGSSKTKVRAYNTSETKQKVVRGKEEKHHKNRFDADFDNFRNSAPQGMEVSSKIHSNLALKFHD